MPRKSALLLVNIGQLLTLRSAATGPRRGASLSDLGIIDDAAVLCLGGKIVSVGTTKDALRDPWLKKNRKKVTEIDCGGASRFRALSTRILTRSSRIRGWWILRSVFPARATNRSQKQAEEFARASMECAMSSKAALTQKVFSAFAEMSLHGTTTVEAKSGYGLSLESELKSLEAIRAAARHWPGTVISTFLGAHTVAPEFRGRSQDYVDLICNEMIPAYSEAETCAVCRRILRARSIYLRRSQRNFRGSRSTGPCRKSPRRSTQRDAPCGAAQVSSSVARPHGLRE